MGRLGNADPERGAGPGPRLRRRRRTSSWPASGPTSRPPTNPTPAFFDEQLDRFEAVAAAVKAEFPAVARPRRQQRRRLPRAAAPTSTWPAAASRSTASTPSRATRPSAAWRRRSRCAPTSPTSSASRPAPAPATAQRWTAPSDTWVGVVPLGYGDGVRRGLGNNAEVLVGGRRRPAGRDRLDGQPDDRPRSRDRRRARRRGGPDRRPGRGGDPRRGARRPARHDQLRGHLRDLRPGAAPRRVAS